MGDLNLIAPLGKSDHVCIEIKIKMKPAIEYTHRKERHWLYLLDWLVSDEGDDIILQL